MFSQTDFKFFQGNSLSDLFAQDIENESCALILNYPATAKWAAYPNVQKYFLQDGSSEATKTSFDKICQKEPWKNLAVLGDTLPGVVISPPRNLLMQYWQEHFGFRDQQLEMMDCSTYLDDFNQSNHLSQAITLFPFDRLLPEKHAVNPDTHYRLLSKATLAKLGVLCPIYQTYDLKRVDLNQIQLPSEYPYLIKTSHGLSGEGTYIIRSSSDLNYCLEELRKYMRINLLETIIVSEFVKHEVGNYCVQFYVNKAGKITLIGVTQQLVSPEGNYLGGLVDYTDDLSKFLQMILAVGQYAYQQGYFGIIGFDVLEDRDGKLYAIDANFRINGSTPLCLQRHLLLKHDKAIAKYSSDYRMEGTLDSILLTLKSELERKDFLILSALEKVKYGKIYTEIYGIVTGKSLQDMQQIEQSLYSKGLHLTS
ncbi:MULTISPECIES: ATP-grasp domain-containing protein [Cyanophyceae]|uniref:ATP-grasp domain-containing protein n=1 Tax=Cyanophyceae TaxID=3028117 RepID=UPI001686FB2D|nr:MULTISPECIES: ATP-grasp domain-containing protein [Cyanophyceae]MBD1918930.1 ATP-grasp domain-containing protein [Phormidium sp. FACHB-77]MBD2033228.1 ATP-grasp domain-containing protein [Phormidium sp. FACHB-322]MBD2053839.1 ATP-grasp domain-containing protein [Leptolyngbya sp. FACHB-60]